MNLESKVPSGPLAEKWTNYKKTQSLINPANKRKYTVLVVGSGLAGASAAATLAELGYNVLCFCFQDSWVLLFPSPSAGEGLGVRGLANKPQPHRQHDRRIAHEDQTGNSVAQQPYGRHEPLCDEAQRLKHALNAVSEVDE